MIFESISYIALLIAVVLIVVIAFSVTRWKTETRNSFADASFQESIFGAMSNRYGRIQFLLFIVALVCLVVGIMDLLSGYEKRTVKREGIDVVFAIDVSKSMDAQDIAPSRLDKAKNIIFQMVDKLGGDRVGVVLFAGEAYTMLPLTSDYESVKSSIQNVTTDLIGMQGTHVEAAIAESALSLQNKSATGKVIVLLSDGEDHEEGKGNAVDIANSYGIQIMSVGIGTEKGSPIPDYKQGIEQGNVLDENGDVVISRREDSVLKELSDETQAKYTIGNNTNETIEALLQQFSSLKRNEQGEAFTYSAQHHYQWFIGIALVVLLILSFWNIKRNFLL